MSLRRAAVVRCCVLRGLEGISLLCLGGLLLCTQRPRGHELVVCSHFARALAASTAMRAQRRPSSPFIPWPIRPPGISQAKPARLPPGTAGAVHATGLCIPGALERKLAEADLLERARRAV